MNGNWVVSFGISLSDFEGFHSIFAVFILICAVFLLFYGLKY